MTRFLQRLPMRHDTFTQPAAAPAPAPVATVPAVDASPHLILHAFTANNILAGTILSGAYDLGAVSSFHEVNLTAIEHAIAAYTIPAGLPDYKLHLLSGEPQFSLTVELVGQQHFHTLPAIA